MKQGLVVSIVAPSGGGKTTVVNELVKQLPKAVRFVTTTSRLPRPGETNGVDYHFLTRSEFVSKITRGELIEYIEFAGQFYGMDRLEMDAMVAKFDYVLAPIDVRGVQSLQALPYRQLRIFLKPESLGVLRTRLSRRPGMSAAELERRLAYAEGEIAQSDQFDVTILNREGYLGETVSAVKELLTRTPK